MDKQTNQNTTHKMMGLFKEKKEVKQKDNLKQTNENTTHKTMGLLKKKK